MFLTCTANFDISNGYHGNSFKPIVLKFGILVPDPIPSKQKVCANRTRIDEFKFSRSNVKVPESTEQSSWVPITVDEFSAYLSTRLLLFVPVDYLSFLCMLSFLYFIRDRMKENPNFIEENMNDICASIQYTIVDVLMNKVKRAVRETGIKEVAIAGGVSANSGLQNALKEVAAKHAWTVYIPQLGYSLDNAAMVAIAGYFKYLKKDFVEQDTAPFARMTIK